MGGAHDVADLGGLRAVGAARTRRLAFDLACVERPGSVCPLAVAAGESKGGSRGGTGDLHLAVWGERMRGRQGPSRMRRPAASWGTRRSEWQTLNVQPVTRKREPRTAAGAGVVALGVAAR